MAHVYNHKLLHGTKMKIKNYVNTKITCNKCSFDYFHWLLNYGKLYRKDGVLLAVHTSGASLQSSASHLLTFLVAQLQFLREWKLSDRRLYEVFERRLLIWGNSKERNSPDYYPFQKHAFFLRHPLFPNTLCFRFLGILFLKICLFSTLNIFVILYLVFGLSLLKPSGIQGLDFFKNNFQALLYQDKGVCTNYTPSLQPSF